MLPLFTEEGLGRPETEGGEMLSRRGFVLGGVAAAGGAAALSAWSYQRSAAVWRTAVEGTWRHAQSFSDSDMKVRRELIRYASLAPSSHNTQCWSFGIRNDAITIRPDLTRRCAIVDPDDHHLFISLGCAAENLLQAAPAFGLMGETVLEGPEKQIRIGLGATRSSQTELFRAITERQSTRSEYDGRKVDAAALRRLETCAPVGDIQIVTDKSRIEKILEFIVEANTRQIEDPDFVEELVKWIRFSHGEAVATGDGLFSATSGNPALPRAIGKAMFNLIFSAGSENDKYARQVRSSAGLAIFSSERSDWQHWFEVGRCFERFALQAATLGIRNAHLNQPVEVPELRGQLADYLGLGDRRPDLIVRFGYGAAMPRSLRRPIDEIIAA